MLDSRTVAADDFPQASKSLATAIATGNDLALEDAARKVILDNSPRAVELICRTLPRANPSQHWLLIAQLSNLSTTEALGRLGDEVLSNKSPELRRDLMMSLRHCSSTVSNDQLNRVLQKGTVDLQASAIDELVDRGVVAIIPTCIELAEKDVQGDRELTRRCQKAIKALTGTPPEGPPSSWRAWWESRNKPSENLDSSKPGPRSTVVETLRRTRLTDFEDLKKGKKEDLLVVQGASDSVQDVLTRLEIGHTLVGYERLGTKEGVPIGSYLAIFVNCGTADWPPAQAEKARKFVEAGGYLFVTDIGMMQLIKHAFPGVLDFGKGSLNDMVAEIVPTRGSTGHPMLRGIDLPVTTTGPTKRLKWLIDSGGPSIQFDPKRAVGLVESPDLLKKRKPPTVAFTFIHQVDTRPLQAGIATGGTFEEFSDLSGGRVLCVLSHFAKQKDNEDGFILQNLLINFLIEAKDRAAQREARAAQQPKKNK